MRSEVGESVLEGIGYGNESITSLYIHWCTAEKFVGLPLAKKSREDLDGRAAKTLLAVLEAHSTFTRLQVWYALLYVVVEGYQELGDQDGEIDELWADAEMVEAMRRSERRVPSAKESAFRQAARIPYERWKRSLASQTQCRVREIL